MEGKVILDVSTKNTDHTLEKRVIQYSEEVYKNHEYKRLAGIIEACELQEKIIDISEPTIQFYALKIVYAKEKAEEEEKTNNSKINLVIELDEETIYKELEKLITKNMRVKLGGLR